MGRAGAHKGRPYGSRCRAMNRPPKGRPLWPPAARLMVNKITTVPKSKIGARIGRLDDEDILRLNQAIVVFLGLAVSPRARKPSNL